MTDNGKSSAVLCLIVRPHLERGGFHLDRFDAWLDGELITTSRQPLLDGARVLLARGFDPNATLAMRHASRDYDSFQPQERWQPPKHVDSFTHAASPGREGHRMRGSLPATARSHSQPADVGSRTSSHPSHVAAV